MNAKRQLQDLHRNQFESAPSRVGPAQIDSR
jgi:hypothetical protein